MMSTWRIHHPKIVISILALTLSAALGLIVVLGLTVKPKIVSVTPSNEALALVSPLKVRFNVPPARRFIEPKLTPDVEGSWSWEGGIFGGHMARTLIFEPEIAWAADQEYQLEINGVTGFIPQSEKQVATAKFLTKALPIIVSASVAENQADVLADQPLSVGLDQPPGEVVDFTFRLEPEAELTVTMEPGSKSYKLQPKNALRQGQAYVLVVEREIVKVSRASNTVLARESKTKVFERRFHTKAPPQLQRFSPEGASVLPNAKQLTIVFNSPMVRSEVEAAIALSPQPRGRWNWQDDTTLVYDFEEELKKATRYNVTLKKGVHSQSGTFLESDVNFGFTTVGVIRVTGVSPARKAGNPVGSEIRLTFDQPVDQASAEKNFSITPAISGAIRWQGQTLIFKPSEALSYNGEYKITLARGVKSIYGLDLTSDYAHSFSTEEKVVMLNIAWDRQDRALSCEAAALKMALAGKGVRVSEDDIMAHVGYDPTPRGGDSWGDPDIAFVGDINGAQNSTGYGVHWSPIARAAQVWRPATAFSGWGASDLAREIEAGNPVIIWGITGPSFYNPWTTPAGKKIDGWKGEHARTVIGFKGSVAKPTSFIINDPQAGRITWSTSKLLGNWATFNNSGVVVY